MIESHQSARAHPRKSLSRIHVPLLLLVAVLAVVVHTACSRVGGSEKRPVSSIVAVEIAANTLGVPKTFEGQITVVEAEVGPASPNTLAPAATATTRHTVWVVTLSPKNTVGAGWTAYIAVDSGRFLGGYISK